MNSLFLVICGMSLAFFGIFFVACHRDASRKTPRRSRVVKVSPEIGAIDPLVGQHNLTQLERQMAEFLTSHPLAASRDSSGLVQQARRPY